MDFLVFLLGVLTICWVSAHEQPDFRKISYNELGRHMTKYERPGVTHFTHVQISENTRQIIAGARNHLVRLSLSKSLDEEEVVEWTPSSADKRMCKSMRESKDKCHNYIKVLILSEDTGQIFTCGTRAYRPLCTWRSLSNLEEVLQERDGRGICPYDPDKHSSALWTSSGDLVGATTMDLSGRDTAIFRWFHNDTEPTYPRTISNNANWLQRPEFVSSMEMGNYMYVFFRELAMEQKGCGVTAEVSRVARLCLNDRGAQTGFMADNFWTSFSKAKLNCSLPGKLGMDFTNLQSTVYDAEQGIIYGLFTSGVNYLPGSAVCAFNVTSFEESFNGQFRAQRAEGEYWRGTANPFPHNRCKHMRHSRDLTSDDINHIQELQLMQEAVQPLTAAPLYHDMGERWQHMLVDHVTTSTGQVYDVIFVSTDKGTIKKFSRSSEKQNVAGCFLEELQVLEPGSDNVINTMSLHHGHLIIGTNQNLMRISVHRCRRYTNRKACLAAADPYCGWYLPEDRCMYFTAKLDAEKFVQNPAKCPENNIRVDGGWSTWQKWERCSRLDSHSNKQTDCLCRNRQCDSPVPKNGGKICMGQTMEVTNCTVHGGWSPWTSWGACSRDCGKGRKERRRWCSNPAPQVGGRTCGGDAVEYAECLGKCCDKNSVGSECSGQWLAWNAWSPCSRPCGGGYRHRSRDCGGTGCSGSPSQFEDCNAHHCSKSVKWTPWTPWFRVNKTRSGWYEQRLKSACAAAVPHADLLWVHTVDMETRACSDRDGCYIVDESPRDLTPYSGSPEDGDGLYPWSPCSRDCGGGTQRRYRPDGKEVEQRMCNIQPCRDVWSEWSLFSTCSVTCGTGSQFRSRDCLGDVCSEGGEREERECGRVPCPGQDEGNGGIPIPTYVDVKTESSTEEEEKDSGKFHLYHLIIVGLSCFLVGAIVAVLLVVYIQKLRKSNNAQKGPNLKNINKHQDSTPNFYMSTAESWNNLRYTTVGSLPRAGTLRNDRTATLNKESRRRSKSGDYDYNRDSLMRTNLSLNDL